jgi:hypothetical protein
VAHLKPSAKMGDWARVCEQWASLCCLDWLRLILGSSIRIGMTCHLPATFVHYRVLRYAVIGPCFIHFARGGGQRIRGKIKLGNGSSCRYTRIQARNASAKQRAGRKSSIIGSGRSVTPEILGRGGVVTTNQMPVRCRLFCPMEEFVGRRGPGVWQEKPRPAHSHSWRLMPSYLPSGLSVQCSVGRPGC